MATVLDRKHFKLNIDQYQKMSEVGILIDGDRVELIDGELICQAQTRPITVDEYHKMIEAGILGARDPVELIDGELILKMAPIGLKHAWTVARLNALLLGRAKGKALLWPQNPLVLAPLSEPEPDFILLRPREGDYSDRMPLGKDCLLVIEVSDSTLSYDRTVKQRLYARESVPEYWIVNLDARLIEAYRTPVGEQYSEKHAVKPGSTISPLLLPHLSLEVAEIFPPANE